MNPYSGEISVFGATIFPPAVSILSNIYYLLPPPIHY
jgi:hypothetical protein